MNFLISHLAAKIEYSPELQNELLRSIFLLAIPPMPSIL